MSANLAIYVAWVAFTPSLSNAQSCYPVASPTPSESYQFVRDYPCDTVFEPTTNEADHSASLSAVINSAPDLNRDGVTAICIPNKLTLKSPISITRSQVHLMGNSRHRTNLSGANLAIEGRGIRIANFESINSIHIKTAAQVQGIENISQLGGMYISEAKTVNRLHDISAAPNRENRIWIDAGSVQAISRVNGFHIDIRPKTTVESIMDFEGTLEIDGQVNRIGRFKGAIYTLPTASVALIHDAVLTNGSLSGKLSAIDCFQFGDVTVDGSVGRIRAYANALAENLPPRTKQQLRIESTGTIKIMQDGTLVATKDIPLVVDGTVGRIDRLSITNPGAGPTGMQVSGHVGTLNRFTIESNNLQSQNPFAPGYNPINVQLPALAIYTNGQGSGGGISNLTNGTLKSSQRRFLQVDGVDVPSPDEYRLGIMKSVQFEP